MKRPKFPAGFPLFGDAHVESASPMPRVTRRRVIASALGLATVTRSSGSSMAKDKREEVVGQLLGDMGLRQRVAQLFMFQAHGTSMTSSFEHLLLTVEPGGIVFVQPNIGTHDQVEDFLRAIHQSNQACPPIIAIDQEGGNVVRLGGDPAPGAMELGRLGDNDARAKARDRARFLAGFGFDANFAPVADVAYRADSTMYLRSFGSDPKAVAATVSQVVRGSRQLSMMGAAKHFPGHGRTSVDSHFAIPEVQLTWNDWKQTDGLPFKAAIQSGIEMVMVGHLRYTEWDDLPMSISKVAVKTLRTKLDFDGVIVTDDLRMGALAGMNAFDVLDRATDAGMDILLYTMPPVPWEQMVDHVVKRVRAGDVPRERIDASVRRILRLKVDHFGLSGKDD